MIPSPSTINHVAACYTPVPSDSPFPSVNMKDKRGLYSDEPEQLDFKSWMIVMKAKMKEKGADLHAIVQEFERRHSESDLNDTELAKQVLQLMVELSKQKVGNYTTSEEMPNKQDNNRYMSRL